MAGLLFLIFVAALIGVFRPYLKGVTRLQFAIAAFMAFVGVSFSAPQSGIVTTSQPTSFALAEQLQADAAGTIADDNLSVFFTKEFEGISISLPKGWRWMDQADSESLNTDSEALTESLGIGGGQENNTILAAGNAFNDARVSVATVRLSVRSASTISQADLQEALKEPQDPIDREIRQIAEKTAAAMRKLPQVSFYNVTGGGLRQNGALVCSWSGFEYDIGKGPTVSDTWVCPASNRTFKLSTSYAKDRTNLFAATVDHIWHSLSLGPVS